MTSSISDTNRIIAAVASAVVLFTGGSLLDSSASASPATTQHPSHDAVRGVVFHNTVSTPALLRPKKPSSKATRKAVRGTVFKPARAATTQASAVRMVRPPQMRTVTKGIRPSLYTGKHYNPKFEMVRRCIVKRESEGRYNAVYHDPTVSTASGAYQFIHPTSDAVAKMMHRNDLVGIPASKWSRKTQDKAFWTLWNDGKGKRNWEGGRWDCWKNAK